MDVGNGTHPPKQRRHFLIAARLIQGCVDEAAHPAVLLEIGIDEALGFLSVNAELLRQSERRQPIDDAEVYRLGAAAMLRIDHQRRHSEHLRGGEGVNVLAGSVGLDQQLVAGEVRQQTQFDLRVVGGQQHVPGLGDEGSADFAAKLGANRNILQVGIHGREPSGGRAGHVEGGVQPPGARVDQHRQRVHVG